MSKRSVEAKAKSVFWQALAYGLGIAVMVPVLNMGLTKLGVRLG